MKSLYGIVLFLLVNLNYAFTQKAEKRAVEAAINQLFDGMRAGDSAKVSAVFHPKVVLQGIHFSEKRNTQVYSTGASLKDFLKAIGTPHPVMWDEKIGKIKIKIDGPMAHAWCNYQFFIGPQFSHCGVDSITFFNDNGTWKIVQLIDTRRTTNCPKL